MRYTKIGALMLSALFLWDCGINLLPSRDEWYGKHYYIMQEFEWQTYKQLSPEARLEFQKLFWEYRTPEAKAEFDKRIAYCLETFKRENSHQPFNVDRAHVYLLNGNPAQIEYSTNDSWMMQTAAGGGGLGAAGVDDRSGEDVSARRAEIWTYRFGQWLIQYVFAFRPPADWKLYRASVQDSRYLGQFEFANRTGLYGIENMADYRDKIDALLAIKEQKK